MSRRLVPDHRQKDKIADLVSDLGVKQYREAKAALGLGRMAPFQRFSYADAFRLIEMLESLRRERRGENGTMSCSQQPHLPQSQPIGLPEPASAGGGGEG